MTSNINIKQRGFTIVELLIVIVVIAILAAISIGMYLGIQQRARDAQRTSEVNGIAKAITAFASEETFGGWTTLDTVAEAQAALGSYQTVQTSEDVLDKLSAGGGADAGTQDNYGYILCPSGATEVAGDATGIQLRWWSEGSTAPMTTNVGSGC